MKNLHLVIIAAAGAAILAGCGNSTPKADLKTDLDTLSYTFGLANSRGLKEYLVGRMGVDTTYIEQFIKGVYDGMKSGEDKKKAAYNAGVQIGQQISNQMVPGINGEIFRDDTTKTISVKNFMSGFLTGVRNEPGIMTQDEAMLVFRMKLDQVKAQVAEERYGANKAEGEKFLAENAKKEGVVTLPSGVQYKILKEGTGEQPADTSVVKVNYEGKLLNDTIFDSSYRRGTPSQFQVKRLIPGWQEALKLMPVGSTWEIYIPQEQAYGAQGQPKIDPFSALIFKVELLEIVK